MNPSTKSFVLTRGIAYKGLSLAGNEIQVVFVCNEGDLYRVIYRDKPWKAELRKNSKGKYFQLIEKE